ncbi:hypothetical protein ACB092_04G163400 [Castanea dentata]
MVPNGCKDLQVEALKYSLGCSSSKCYIPLFQMMPSTLERLGKQKGIFFSLGNKPNKFYLRLPDFGLNLNGTKAKIHHKTSRITTELVETRDNIHASSKIVNKEILYLIRIRLLPLMILL